MTQIHRTTIRLLLLAALSLPAYRLSTAQQDAMPSAQHQLESLSSALSLSDAQKERIKPILEHLHDTSVQLTQDPNLTQEERLARIHPERIKARDEIRALLNDQQQKNLDIYLQSPHNDLHGNLTGNTR